MESGTAWDERVEAFLAWGGVRRDICFLAVSAAGLLASMVADGSIMPDPAWIAIVLCGIPIMLEAAVALVTEHDIKADLLVSLALIASVAIGEDFAAGEVALIMQLGGLLEELTVARAQKGISELAEAVPDVARVMRDGGEEMVPAAEVAQGERVRILPGETIPVDGTIVSGTTSVDQSLMTGEPVPADKGVGDSVLSGTLNQFGAIDIVAEGVGEERAIERMARLVAQADAQKAPIVRMADRWATWIVVGALSAAALSWLATGEIVRAVTVLVVFCPCSLVLATPTAVMAGIGNASKHGCLVKEGDALERLAKVERICFDKTGTLTLGHPEVVSAEVSSAWKGQLSEGKLLELVASAESLSEHPLGRAIAKSVKGGAQALVPESFEMVPGRGIKAAVAGRQLLAGNEELLEDEGVELGSEARSCAERIQNKGQTAVFIALDGSLAGIVALADQLRPDAAQGVSALAALRVEPCLLTGDAEAAARSVASRLGIERTVAKCLPEDKLRCIAQMESEGTPVLMVGDGVNDAPALRRASVGIAMGAAGSAIAVDAAAAALVHDSLQELPYLIALSRHMMRVIRANLTFSMALNFVAVALAMAGIMGPVAGALVHNAGSVFVILNSAFLLRWGRKREGIEGCTAGEAAVHGKRPEPGRAAIG